MIDRKKQFAEDGSLKTERISSPLTLKLVTVNACL